MKITLKQNTDVDARFTAPPSKSYTHRALIIASLAEGRSLIEDPLFSGDTRCTMDALRSCGIDLVERPGHVEIAGCDGHPSCPSGLELDLEHSGTSYRLLSGYALLCGTPVVLTGSPRMQERPIGPLAEGLNALGGKVTFLGQPGYPPIQVSGSLKGGQVAVDGRISSQFISSILIAAPYADVPVDLRVTGEPASRSYLDLTCDTIQAFGGRVEREGYSHFQVSTKDRYRGRTYEIEGDYSSASYFFAVAAVCGGTIRVEHLNPDSLQGDRLFVHALEQMGCNVHQDGMSTLISSDGTLDGITIDMSTSPDTVQTLCVVAACARSPTRITGVAHLRHKESNRLEGTAARLNSLGGSMVVSEDSITILPSRLHGGTIDPGNDHRTAMSFAVLGLHTGGITVLDAECVNKSFPGFWGQFERAGLL